MALRLAPPPQADAPRRYVTEADLEARRPVYAIWELTLRCNLRCAHCGSRAGKARPSELSTQECFAVVRQLADLGVREVTLIGGEAYLRRDWLDIVRAVRAAGMDCSLGTGGYALTAERVRGAAEAGLQSASVSIDGLAEAHDEVRGVKGSWDRAVGAVKLIREHGMVPAVTTQLNRKASKQLFELLDVITGAGAQNWQVQLTMPMGNAADRPELLVQPFELLELFPTLGRVFEAAFERGIVMQAGNNVGYFGPYERYWRGDAFGRGHWIGCNAGTNTIGLQADGEVKGCSSLPTQAWAGGNVRTAPLEEIWNQSERLTFNSTRSAEQLWGFCNGCYYAEVCRAGCTWTSQVLFGKVGNNPYCHHRALELEREGQGERLRKVEDAQGRPFDHGRFEVDLLPLAQLRKEAT